MAKTSIRVSILSALLSPVTYIITNAAIILIIWFGAQNVNAGNGMLSGDIIALVNYMTQILLAMIVVANLVVLFTKASASAARLNEVFETQPSVCESTTENIEISESESTPKIEFDNVNFTYGTGDDELEDISFKSSVVRRSVLSAVRVAVKVRLSTLSPVFTMQHRVL